jgi:hypothetical protein
VVVVTFAPFVVVVVQIPFSNDSVVPFGLAANAGTAENAIVIAMTAAVINIVMRLRIRIPLSHPPYVPCRCFLPIGSYFPLRYLLFSLPFPKRKTGQ